METFFAALEAGADAVYVGAHAFNARLRARNFTPEELASMAAYAHARGRRLYVTLNTLVKEQELPELVRTLDVLRRVGPDALIIQDFGVYRLARRLAPELPLHASTQMTIHNLDGALQAQRMGFERVILARELTLDEIRAIRASSTIELETFVHGALCFSISGQCLFSSYVHGKSANRGRCMQPCRRAFEFHDASGHVQSATAFSTRDLSAAPFLSQLIAAGIRSFKIEGRLKPAQTIAQIVGAYRVLIDAYPNLTHEAVSEARTRLDRAVGRDTCSGYYLSPTPADLIDPEALSHSGRRLGIAQRGEGRHFSLMPEAAVKTGDRLRVQISEHEPPRAFMVRRLFADGRECKRCRPRQRIELDAGFEVPVGALVFKVADADALEKGAERGYERFLADLPQGRKTFPCTVRESGPTAISLEICVGKERLALTHGLTWNGEMTRSQFAARLSAASEADGLALDVPAVEVDEPLALSEVDVDALRGKALARVARLLDRQREAALAGLTAPLVSAPSPDFPRHLIRVRTVEDAGVAAEEMRGMDGVCLIVPLHEARRPEFREQLKRTDVHIRWAVALPEFSFDVSRREHLKQGFLEVLELGVRNIAVSNPAHLHLLHTTGRKGIATFALPSFGCMNRAFAEELLEQGVHRVTFALEGDIVTLRALTEHFPPARLAVQLYGHIPLFQTRSATDIPLGETLKLLDPARRVRVEQNGDVTSVVSHRAVSWAKYRAVFEELSIATFLYDCRFTADLRRTLRRLFSTEAQDTSRESDFNFETGLE